MNNSILQRTANYLQGLGSNVCFFLILCGKNIRFTGSTCSIFHVAWGTQTSIEGEEQADTEAIASHGHGSRTCHGGLVLNEDNTMF